jgi:hypothetical protein
MDASQYQVTVMLEEAVDEIGPGWGSDNSSETEAWFLMALCKQIYP